MPDVSTAQLNAEAAIRNAISRHGWTLLTDRDAKASPDPDVRKTAKNWLEFFPAARKDVYTADFCVPKLGLAIEYSGSNYFQKVVTMKQTHEIALASSDRHYVAIIEANAYPLSLPHATVQVAELCACLAANSPPEPGWTAHSLDRLDRYVRTFWDMYTGVVG